MISFNKWYIFNDENDNWIFLRYAEHLGAIKLKDGQAFPSEFIDADCLRIRINNGYVINYRTVFNEAYMPDAIVFGDTEREFIRNELNKGDNKMTEVYKETATVRSIMEREYNREMRELEAAQNKEIDEAYCICEIGKQAKLLATLIQANTTLDIDFKTFLSVDILPLNAQRAIQQIRQNYKDKMEELAHKYQNLEAMLSICETYEQKRDLLKKNKIIK